jgi:arylformamidase
VAAEPPSVAERGDDVARFVELGHAFQDLRSVPARRIPTRIAGDVSAYVDGGRRERVDQRGIPLASVAGLPGLVVDAPIPPQAVALELAGSAAQDRAVLVRTGWEKRWGTDAYQQDPPYLRPESIDVLVRGGAAIVGIDFCALGASDGGLGVARLLRAGVLVVENLCNLSALPADGFRFFAVPLAAPSDPEVRAFAELLPR